MTYMKIVVDGYKDRGLPQKFAVGGAPISQEYADEIGAHGYGADASSAVDLFLYFMGKGPPPKAKSKQQAIDEVKAQREESRVQRDPNAKSKFQILYWQDIPSQIKVWDDFDEVKISLPEKFATRIDASAQKQGLISQDAYSAHLRWGEIVERAGSSREVAAAVKSELETKFA
jgi:hypothetical protein